MSEKMRESFEAWASQFFRIDAEPWGEYADNETQWAWLSWQASRAALVVELPELKSFNASDEPDFAYEVAIDDIKCALDGSGVSYK